MKPIEELGTSPAPWELEIDHTPWRANVIAVNASDGDEVVRDCFEDDARLIAAAPDLYEALRDCCEEAMGDNVPRCYACRKGEDGHCMAATEKRCAVYAALEKAGGAK